MPEIVLKAFFEPASVAVIGASTDPAKLGHAVLKNLVEGGYVRHGKVYPINAQAKEILGYPAYPSVLDVLNPIWWLTTRYAACPSWKTVVWCALSLVAMCGAQRPLARRR